MARTGTHNYNTRSRTKRVNHMKTFKNIPDVFKMDTADTIKTHIGTYYISHTHLKKYIITVEPLVKHINCETTGKILGYRYLVKVDVPVRTNSMCNKLGRIYQG